MVKEHDDGKICGCGHLCKGVEVPTEDELAALNAMRAIKEKVKSLKEKVGTASCPGDGGKGVEALAIHREIDRLKAEWQGWEEKRKQAARERMVLLGHEEP